MYMCVSHQSSYTENNLSTSIGQFKEMDSPGQLSETICSGNKLISLLHKVELVACNGRQLVSEPEWTRVRPSLDQKSVIV